MDAQAQQAEVQGTPETGYWVEVVGGSSNQGDVSRMEQDHLIRLQVAIGDAELVLFVRRRDVKVTGFLIPDGTAVFTKIGQGSATQYVQRGHIGGSCIFAKDGSSIGALTLWGDQILNERSA